MSKAAAQSPKTELDFVQARKNMVDCQIHTSGVVHTGLLQAFETVPRELFVPEHLKGIAYFDEDIQLAKGRYLSEPLILSKMLQAADLQSDDVVLDIGGGTGYCAAILSSNVSTIIAVESDDAYIAAAKSNWSELDACNIVQVKAKLAQGVADQAPYDLIVLHGAVPEVPTKLVAQLNENGRMLCILKPEQGSLGKATLVRKNANAADGLGENAFSSYTLFECGAEYLEGFAPKSTFSF